MSGSNGARQRYKVSMSQAVEARLLQLHAQEHAFQRGQRFLAAYSYIMRRLERDPQVFGEKLYTLPAMELDVRQAIHDRVVVDYGVHEDHKIVFVREFRLLT